MRIAFGAPTLYRPAAMSAPSASTAAPSSATTDTDFRDNLPPLAFSGLLGRTKPHEPTELELAQQYALPHLIPDISEELQEQLIPRYSNNKLRVIELNGSFETDFKHPKVLKDIRENLARRTLDFTKTKHTPRNLSAAEYASLLLISRLNPDEQEAFLEEGMRDLSKAKHRPYLYQRLAEATDAVHEWLDTVDISTKMLRIKLQKDLLDRLGAMEEQLSRKKPRTEKEEALLTETRNQITQGKEHLSSDVQALQALDRPELPDSLIGIAPDIADEVRIESEALIALQRVDTPKEIEK